MMKRLSAAAVLAALFVSGLDSFAAGNFKAAPAGASIGARIRVRAVAPGALVRSRLPAQTGSARLADVVGKTNISADRVISPAFAKQGAELAGELRDERASMEQRAGAVAERTTRWMQTGDAADIGLPSRERNEEFPDTNYSWADHFTKRIETQASKIGKARVMALQHPLTRKIYERLKQNGVHPLYKVVPTHSADYYSRVLGDDPEIPAEKEPVVIFTSWILPNLALESIAADMASQWAMLWYGKHNGAPIRQSAEKNYIKGSILAQVFKFLSGSTYNNWRGDLDHHTGYDRRHDPIFRIWQHFFHWRETAGSGADTVRRGDYFRNKIMGNEGDPEILTDERGRQTLYGRWQAGEITEQAATIGQKAFEEFVSYVDNSR